MKEQKTVGKLVAWCALAIITFSFIIYFYQIVKDFSYSKLTPLSVEVEFSSTIDTNVQLQYDYGYGFNAQHEQSIALKASDLRQILSSNISSWKKIQRIRVITPLSEEIVPGSVSLILGDNRLRVAREWPVTDLGQTLLLDNVDQLLSRNRIVDSSNN